MGSHDSSPYSPHDPVYWATRMASTGRHVRMRRARDHVSLPSGRGGPSAAAVSGMAVLLAPGPSPAAPSDSRWPRNAIHAGNHTAGSAPKQ